jgi:hypothetical protein
VLVLCQGCFAETGGEWGTGTAESNACVYGYFGLSYNASLLASSMMTSRDITATRSQMRKLCRACLSHVKNSSMAST